MRAINNHGFGCNIMALSNAQHEIAHDDIKTLVKKITNRVKKSYANVLMINLSSNEFDYEGAYDKMEELVKVFPLIDVKYIPSSMGTYSTRLYILDVSEIKREYYYSRSNANLPKDLCD